MPDYDLNLARPSEPARMDGLMIGALFESAQPYRFDQIIHHKPGCSPHGVETVELWRSGENPLANDHVPQDLQVSLIARDRNSTRYAVSSSSVPIAIAPETLGDWGKVLDAVDSAAHNFQREHQANLRSRDLVLTKLPKFVRPSRRFGLDRPSLPLDLPFELVEHTPVSSFAAWGEDHNVNFDIIFHPSQTVTCDEKHALYSENPQLYQTYGPLAVAQGSLLSYREGEERKFVLLAHASGTRVNTKLLKKELGISKKRDLKFTHSDQVAPMTGLLVGAISPFLSYQHRVHHIVFHRSLLDGQMEEPNMRFDFAFAPDRSVLVKASDLYAFLDQHSVLGRSLHPRIFED